MPHSIFKTVEITSISQIFELYLFYQINQEVVDTITLQSAVFLHEKKGIDSKLIENNFSLLFEYNEKGDYFSVSGKNLLSSLWVTGVYPEHPEKLVNKRVYKEGDFTYRFDTKTRNLVKLKTKYERKPRNYSRNLKIPKRT